MHVRCYCVQCVVQSEVYDVITDTFERRTPAEEGGAGKVRLIEAGVFKDIDAALMYACTRTHICAAR